MRIACARAQPLHLRAHFRAPARDVREVKVHSPMFWNFVASSKERIEQAKRDWKNGQFGKIPRDSDEFIPLPEG